MTRIVSLENVSTDPASAIEDGSETSASTAKGGSSKCTACAAFTFHQRDKHQITSTVFVLTGLNSGFDLVVAVIHQAAVSVEIITQETVACMRKTL